MILKRYSKKFLDKYIEDEFDKASTSHSTSPDPDWNLIWVLTGAKFSIDDFKNSDDIEMKRRLRTGILVALKIASLKSGRRDLGFGEIKKWAPGIYISGYDEQNIVLQKLKGENHFKSRFGFPDTKIAVGGKEHIKNTIDQFKKFPARKWPAKGKLVILTDAYHMPRVILYARTIFRKDWLGRTVFITAEPRYIPSELVLLEKDKIRKYFEKV
ncbi:MAG: hypothetical protein Q7S45_04320 [Candidatus Curtissbacteria bacterium]|nr:hypothetical protein [Candidatus Curtissbacteria bacterium]